MSEKTEGYNGFDAEAFARAFTKSVPVPMHPDCFQVATDWPAAVKAAYVAGQASRVPDGWQLVPIEPTKVMIRSAFIEMTNPTWAPWFQVISKAYGAMLSSSPKVGK